MHANELIDLIIKYKGNCVIGQCYFRGDHNGFIERTVLRNCKNH
jgi:hypothetical protein